MIKSGYLMAFGAPILRREILANSITTTVGDAVIFDTDGFVALGVAGGGLLGVVENIGTDEGVGLNTTGVAGAAMGSFAGTFLTASDNETVAKNKAEIDISIHSLWQGEADAALATTSGSDQAGVYFDLIDEDSIDESSVVDTTAQVHSWGPHANDTTNDIEMNIFESSVFTTV